MGTTLPNKAYHPSRRAKILSPAWPSVFHILHDTFNVPSRALAIITALNILRCTKEQKSTGEDVVGTRGGVGEERGEYRRGARARR